CERVDESLARHIAVASIARRGPREAALNQMLPDRNVADLQLQSLGAVGCDVTMRVAHEFAVPFFRYLDAIQPAGILARELFCGGYGSERRFLLRPGLVLARNRCDGRRLREQQSRPLESRSRNGDRGEDET